jgi:alpha-maltose-1-phosphate synthase
MRAHPSVLVSHPRGNHNVRQLLEAYAHEGMLSSYRTSLGWRSLRLPTLFTGQTLEQEWLRRAYPMLGPGQLRRHLATREAARVLVGRAPWAAAQRRAYEGRGVGAFALAEAFDKSVAKSLAETIVDLVYGYEDTAAKTFERAKEQGLRTILELPFAHYGYARRILADEAARNPEYADTHRIVRKSTVEEIRRKDRELELADAIVVPSAAVARSLDGVVAASRVLVNPYGLGERGSTPRPTPFAPDVVDLIFVGRLQLDKGIAYLIEAWQELREFCNLTVIGAHPSVTCAPLDRFLSDVRYLGTMPRHQVLAELHRSDAFVLPSLVEGRSLAALEAITAGLVPIVTWSSGVSDVVKHAVNGFIIHEADAGCIVEAVQQLHAGPLLARRRSGTLESANGPTWTDYRAEAVRIARHMVQPGVTRA